MNSNANLAYPLEWLSGRSAPAGRALTVSRISTNDLSGILSLFLLEGSHTTLRGSRSGTGQIPENCRVLGARRPLTSIGKALSVVNALSGKEYKPTRSASCDLGTSHSSPATER